MPPQRLERPSDVMRWAMEPVPEMTTNPPANHTPHSITMPAFSVRIAWSIHGIGTVCLATMGNGKTVATWTPTRAHRAVSGAMQLTVRACGVNRANRVVHDHELLGDHHGLGVEERDQLRLWFWLLKSGHAQALPPHTQHVGRRLHENGARARTIVSHTVSAGRPASSNACPYSSSRVLPTASMPSSCRNESRRIREAAGSKGTRMGANQGTHPLIGAFAVRRGQNAARAAQDNDGGVRGTAATRTTTVNTACGDGKTAAHPSTPAK